MPQAWTSYTPNKSHKSKKKGALSFAQVENAAGRINELRGRLPVLPILPIESESVMEHCKKKKAVPTRVLPVPRPFPLLENVKRG